MKKNILLALIVVAVLLIGGLHVLLKYQLRNLIQKVVVPAASEALHVSVSVGGASVSLLGGSVTVSDIRVGNPKGFTEPESLSVPYAALNLRLLSLLRGVTEVTGLDVRDLNLTIVRNGAGELNIQKLKEAGRGGQAATKPGGQPAETTGPARVPGGETPSVWLPLSGRILARKAKLTGTVRYIDHQLAEPPVEVVLATEAVFENIGNLQGDAVPWGTLSVRGNLAERRDLMVTDLSGKIAPLVDPARPSFDLSGRIVGVDPRIMDTLGLKYGFECDPATLTLDLSCRDGVFDPGRSLLTFHLKNVKLSRKLAKKVGGIDTWPTLTIPAPIKGTIADPQVDFQAALVLSVIQNAGNNLDAILSAASGKSGKSNTVDSVLRNLDHLLKGGKK